MGAVCDGDPDGIKSVLQSLPRLEIFNDRRREGTAPGKKRKQSSLQQNSNSKRICKPPVALSVGGRNFEGKRAVFQEDDSADDRPQKSMRVMESKLRRHGVEDTRRK